MSRLLSIVLLLAVTDASAKEFGVRTPSGRKIYGDNETFESVLDQNLRDFVVEVAVGLAPEGQLGMLVGWLFKYVKGLEFYAGFGVASAPALHYTFATRYLMNILGYRPYIGVGYLLVDLTKVGTLSHNAFLEVGYSFKLHHTFHITVGVGVRRILASTVKSGSPLTEPDVDPVFLQEQLDALGDWVPTAAVRLSRAF